MHIFLGESAEERNAMPLAIVCRFRKCVCMRFEAWFLFSATFDIIVVVVIFFSFVRLSSFFSVEFVDVFVNMAYRYSSGLTRFKSDIYFISIVRTHLSVCLFAVRSLAHSDSFSFRYHAHKNMRLCVGFFFFGFLCLYCSRVCFLMYGRFFYPLWIFSIYLLVESTVLSLCVDKQWTVVLSSSFFYCAKRCVWGECEFSDWMRHCNGICECSQEGNRT